MDENALAAAATVLHEMGGTVRLSVLCALRGGPRTVSQLQGAVDVPQALVSNHLRRLRAAGLVRSDRSPDDARIIFYSIADDRIHRVLDALSL
ncbi:metalloregulator ArsR/SmtB family transcription factor [Loktanella sp. TSTF-M6]|uniref:Metalloregulator ArsR/SmtB family transcription factor n=1 Tax=Loktanella gaetbuli TaxID=2881335 RepID=A0ABS8BPM6_9RHOB|nr:MULTISPECIES: metalloregulator ArsR/SmtB family transcription factor [Loktanella]MCB5197685.1 metalloregulator ArsR/SmtB family transcription factor [Loktanella gaetbuli]